MPAVPPHLIGLTDRYVAAVLAALPADQRGSVEPTLRQRIESAIDAHPGDTLDAEREVLQSLGDPVRLATDYAATPTYLIGPHAYGEYRRLLRLLVTIVPTAMAVVSGVLHAVGGGGVGAVIVTVLTLWFHVTVQVAFWVTLVYALAERYARRPRQPWQVRDLDELAPAQEITLAGVTTSISSYGLVAALLLSLPQLPALTWPGGQTSPVFRADLWPGWVWFFVILLGASAVLEVVTYCRRRWTRRLAIVNLGLGVVFVVPVLVLLLSDQLIEPAAMAQAQAYLGWSRPGLLTVVVAALIVVVATWDAVDAFRRAARPIRHAG